MSPWEKLCWCSSSQVVWTSLEMLGNIPVVRLRCSEEGWALWSEMMSLCWCFATWESPFRVLVFVLRISAVPAAASGNARFKTFGTKKALGTRVMLQGLHLGAGVSWLLLPGVFTACLTPPKPYFGVQNSIAIDTAFLNESRPRSPGRRYIEVVLTRF